MLSENWEKMVDYFCFESHTNRSTVNIENRKLQKYPNRGRTSTYTSYSFKNNMNLLQTFKKAHTRRDGTFDSELAEQQYNDLRLELESQTEPNSEIEYEESPEPHLNAVEVFEKVLGSRRGFIREIGCKPRASLPGSSSHVDPEQTPPPPMTQVFKISLCYYFRFNW